ncbi:MAG: hypothetical protein V1790_14675, partial [Planctomycetota bacterium]
PATPPLASMLQLRPFSPQNLSANVIGSRIMHNFFSHRPFATLLRNRWSDHVGIDIGTADGYDRRAASW